MKKIVRIGTRGSPLALIQAQMARDSVLKGAEESVDFEVEIVPIRTSGDWNPAHKEKSFLEMGAGKSLFTKEIEEALLSGMIDIAVHSMKDVSVWDKPDLVFSAMLERGDPRDALLSPMAPRLEDLPSGARVGTSSLRRKAQILALRPDLEVVPLRGNVDTRLKKLAAEEADATVLAVAGLERLGLTHKIASIFDIDTFLPSPAQGILGLQIRKDEDEAFKKLVEKANHRSTALCALAERAFLRALDGSCRTPIAGLARISPDGRMKIDGLAARSDGRKIVRKKEEGPAEDAEKLGKKLGAAIKAELPEDFFPAC